jgi:hypothetical protein
MKSSFEKIFEKIEKIYCADSNDVNMINKELGREKEQKNKVLQKKLATSGSRLKIIKKIT